MPTQLYFENVKTSKRYRVVRLDKDKGEIVLAGRTGEFVEKYDKERFEGMGYKLVKEEVAARDPDPNE